MNLPTLDCPPDEARDKARQYGSVRNPTDEERALAAGFVALGLGKQVIDMRMALAAGGEHDDGTPRLGLMAANRAWCYMTRSRFGTVTFSGVQHVTPSTAAAHLFQFDRLLAERSDLNGDVAGWWNGAALRSQVPIVPPAHRVKGWRTRCCVLWEVPEWKRAPRPPGDPALVRHLAGDLWVVESTWDLTDLEESKFARTGPEMAA